MENNTTTTVREMELNWPTHSVMLAIRSKPENTETQISTPLSNSVCNDLRLYRCSFSSIWWASCFRTVFFVVNEKSEKLIYKLISKYVGQWSECTTNSRKSASEILFCNGSLTI